MAGTYVLTVSLGFQTEADREEVSKARFGISNAPCRRRRARRRRSVACAAPHLPVRRSLAAAAGGVPTTGRARACQ